MLRTLIKSQHCETALPNTIGIVCASGGFVGGIEAGCLFGSLIASFASDSGSVSHKRLAGIVIGTGVGCGAIGGMICYLGGFGATNLFLQAFPSLKHKKAHLLVPGRLSTTTMFVVCATIIGGRRLQTLGYFNKFAK